LDHAWIEARCAPPSQEHAAAAAARQKELTKPPGSLGKLEHLAVRLAALQSNSRPNVEDVAILLFAADHGVVAQGVSAYPAAVTAQMLQNFAGGGAAISVLARELRAPLRVVDVGTLAQDQIAGVATDKLCCGTRDFSSEPAMTGEELSFALAAGRRAVHREAKTAKLLILGDMGIGNTTAAAALAAALLARPASELTGAGTGLDEAGMAHKANVIAAALARHKLDASPVSPLRALACVGGLEIAALAGAIIAAAQASVPILIDGFIVSVSALAAVRLNPSCQPWLLYSHVSAERGHRLVLEALGAEPLLDLDLRLGEGSGAAIALPILRLACALHAQMATFAEARVSERRP
jgi:nicotinate-nucleotide--dimethylbenzimidazole phosphoribosyltransferase